MTSGAGGQWRPSGAGGHVSRPPRPPESGQRPACLQVGSPRTSKAGPGSRVARVLGARVRPVGWLARQGGSSQGLGPARAAGSSRAQKRGRGRRYRGAAGCRLPAPAPLPRSAPLCPALDGSLAHCPLRAQCETERTLNVQATFSCPFLVWERSLLPPRPASGRNVWAEGGAGGQGAALRGQMLVARCWWPRSLSLPGLACSSVRRGHCHLPVGLPFWLLSGSDGNDCEGTWHGGSPTWQLVGIPWELGQIRVQAALQTGAIGTPGMEPKRQYFKAA